MARPVLSPEKYKEKFYQCFEVDEEGCWLWLKSSKGKLGYGEFSANGKRHLSHRYSYELHKNEIPKGMLVLHKCDNARCVNPDHLEIGTQSKNIKDMYLRERRNVKGENAPVHKLTQINVNALREEYRGGNIYQKDLAKKYSVSRSSISMIINGKRWT